jgi:alanyl-tRNA synthetase
LSGGIVRLNALIEQTRSGGGTAITGEDAFTLQDTYGFPLDLTQRIAADLGLSVDEASYEARMDEQRQRGRAAAQFKRGVDAEIWAERELPPTTFTGYETLHSEGTILALVADGDDVSRAEAGRQVQLVLDRTPFYAESGGQVGDSGRIVAASGVIEVVDTQRPLPGVSVLYGTVVEGSIAPGALVQASVDVARRGDIQRNHTATHMLQRVLRDVVGEHAAQAGSLVAPDRLRFDFTHPRALEPDQLRAIEQRLNRWVRADGAVSWHVTDYPTATANGAIALFGEKYGDAVRVVSIERGDERETKGISEASESGSSFASRDSKELCGGTHVRRTGEIGYIRLLGESSVGSGIRRIEALSGRGAEQWIEAQTASLRELAQKLGATPAQLNERIEMLLDEQKQLRGALESLRAQQTRGALSGLLDAVQRDNGLAVLAAEVSAQDADALRAQGDWLRDKLGSGVIVLGSVINEKPQLLAVVTPDLVKQGYHAGNLVKALAALVGGGGGGRPELAMAGGRDVGKLAEAIAQAPELARAQKRGA